jgi:hypothetical protein
VVGNAVFLGVDVGSGEGFGVLEIIVVGERVGEGVGFLFAEF